MGRNYLNHRINFHHLIYKFFNIYSKYWPTIIISSQSFSINPIIDFINHFKTRSKNN